MRIFLLTIFVWLMYVYSYAQNDQWTIKAGENAKAVLGDSVIFRYPQFTLGSVYFRDGSVSNARLNLNLINGEMQFINLSKDTMTVANEVTIKFITILTDTFYYDKVYVELIHGNAIAKLAKIEVIKSTNMQKRGGYDQLSSASAINTASAYYKDDQISRLTEKKEMTLHKETIYFIGDEFNHFLPAVKKNIYKMFNKKKSAIESFIDENKIVLGKEDDLVKLIDFLAGA